MTAGGRRILVPTLENNKEFGEELTAYFPFTTMQRRNN
jgi:hypothetical protein